MLVLEVHIIKKIKTELILIGILIISIAIIINISSKIFLNYENILVRQQSEHLLTIAESTGRNIENYIQEKRRALDNLAHDIALLNYKDTEKKLEEKLNILENFYLSQEKEIIELIYIDEFQNNFISYPKDASPDKYSLKEIYKGFDSSKEQKTYFINTYFNEEYKDFFLYIYQGIFNEDVFQGIIVAKIEVNNIYTKFIQNLNIGKYGYAIVNDLNGKIIMHPIKDNISLNVFNIKKDLKNKHEISEFSKVVEEQLKLNTGVHIYYSKWWLQKKMQIFKKTSAFTPIYVGENSWFLTIIMSYAEISEPIKSYFYSTMFFSVLIISIFSCFIYFIIKINRSREAYKMETLYLKKLNYNAEILRKKDAELHHKRKIETIGTLTNGIAHEFNNILTPIMGYSEMLLNNNCLDDSIHEDIQIIYESSKKSKEIIEQILINSNVELLKKHEIIPLNQIIENTIKILNKNILLGTEINIYLDKKIHFIMANETKIHQVILNLLKNAYNSMKKSKIKRLNISLENFIHETGKSYSKIIIEDTGCGMDEKTIHQIFKPFFSKKLTKNSTGLGLSVVLDIIKMHNGKIEVKSKLNQGTQFYIYLPNVDYIDNNKTKLKIKNINKEELMGTEKIIIIDDDEFIAKMLKKSLEELGYTTIYFTDALVLLKEINYLYKKGYKIIITDKAMPSMNGIELSKIIREQNLYVKIILMTAYSDEPLKEYYDKKLIDGYIFKPITALQISKCIRNQFKV